RVLGPAVVLGDDRLDGKAAFIQALGQEHAAAQVLVVAVAVAGPPGDKDDFLLLVLSGGGAAKKGDGDDGDERAHGVDPFVRVRGDIPSLPMCYTTSTISAGSSFRSPVV